MQANRNNQIKNEPYQQKMKGTARKKYSKRIINIYLQSEKKYKASYTLTISLTILSNFFPNS